MAFRFSTFLRDITPPWLRRTVGGGVLGGIADVIDAHVQRTVDGVALRFPVAAQPDALGYIGRERRILRGPGESEATFASRLVTWWDAHRTRGGPYALLTQMHLFWRSSTNVPIACVANSGLRHRVDAAGDITRDSIVWSGDGEHPTRWARLFLIFELAGDTIELPLLTESGEPVLTESGEPVLVSVSILSLTAADRELICAVPREWAAAHIDRIYLTLLPAGSWVWGYPPTATWGDPGRIWGAPSAGFTC